MDKESLIITEIVFPGMPPNKCGDARGGVLDFRPEGIKCSNEAKFYVRGTLQANGMFYDLHCFCQECLEKKYPNWRDVLTEWSR